MLTQCTTCHFDDDEAECFTKRSNASTHAFVGPDPPWSFSFDSAVAQRRAMSPCCLLPLCHVVSLQRCRPSGRMPFGNVASRHKFGVSRVWTSRSTCSPLSPSIEFGEVFPFTFLSALAFFAALDPIKTLAFRLAFGLAFVCFGSGSGSCCCFGAARGRAASARFRSASCALFASFALLSRVAVLFRPDVLAGTTSFPAWATPFLAWGFLLLFPFAGPGGFAMFATSKHFLAKNAGSRLCSVLAPWTSTRVASPPTMVIDSAMVRKIDMYSARVTFLRGYTSVRNRYWGNVSQDARQKSRETLRRVAIVQITSRETEQRLTNVQQASHKTILRLGTSRNSAQTSRKMVTTSCDYVNTSRKTT